MSTLEGKVAFVTGASGGIGAAVSRKLAENGVQVGMASRRGDSLGVGLGLTCDARRRDQVEAAVGRTARSSAGSTSASRTPASARTTRSSRHRSSTSRR